MCPQKKETMSTFPNNSDRNPVALNHDEEESVFMGSKLMEKMKYQGFTNGDGKLDLRIIKSFILMRIKKIESN